MDDRLIARIRAYCDKHALLPAGDVLALVSGGADSTVLMHALARLRPGRVKVLSIDHGLRAEAAGEAAAAVEAARRLGLQARLERLALAPGAGVQERAREARLTVARRVAAEEGCEVIATGHTATDQTETILFRMARGTGRTGALGMAPRAGDLVRPLLSVTGEETRAWCAEHGIPFADDPSNADPAFARTRVRHVLSPAMAAVHPAAERHVAAFADRLRDESALLDALGDAAWQRCLRGAGIDVERLTGEHRAVQALLVRRMMDRAGLPGEAHSSEAVARVLQAATDARRVDVPGGTSIVHRGVLTIEGAPDAVPQPSSLGVPGEARFGDFLVRAELGIADAPGKDRVPVRVGGALGVRGPRPGDRVPLPGGGRQAVGRLLAARGVPALHRPSVPVVVVGDEVVWVAGHRANPRLLAPRGSEAVILSLEPS